MTPNHHNKGYYTWVRFDRRVLSPLLRRKHCRRGCAAFHLAIILLPASVPLVLTIHGVYSDTPVRFTRVGLYTIYTPASLASYLHERPPYYQGFVVMVPKQIQTIFDRIGCLFRSISEIF